VDSGGYAQASAQPAASGRSRKLIRPFVSSTVVQSGGTWLQIGTETGSPNSSATNWTTGADSYTVVLHCTTH
jgi:hypothetical protein